MAVATGRSLILGAVVALAQVVQVTQFMVLPHRVEGLVVAVVAHSAQVFPVAVLVVVAVVQALTLTQHHPTLAAVAAALMVAAVVTLKAGLVVELKRPLDMFALTGLQVNN